MITISRNKYGLTERDMATILNILAKYSAVLTVKLFGSRAKGNYKIGSDIDLAVMNEGISSQTIVNLLADFEESLLPYTVDLINHPTLTHVELIEHINRAGVVLYKR